LLLQPFTLGPFVLSNRVVMAPLTRHRADPDGVPSPDAAEYYRQRARAGLIIAEATNISPQARGASGTPGIWTAVQVAAWRRVTAAVHAAGGVIFLQLWHTGRKSHSSVQPGGRAPVAPSALAALGATYVDGRRLDYSVPRALEPAELPGIVDDYRNAAERAAEAGFDGVEIHAANNYLIEQFIRDSSNRRTDEYGGAVENRLRFPLAVARAVASVWGGQRVGIRLSPEIILGGAPDSDIAGTYGAFLNALAPLDLLYVHIVEGATTEPREPLPATSPLNVKRHFSGARIVNNGYDRSIGERAIADGHADLISFGRLFIANPDLVTRFRRGGPFAEAPTAYWYGGGSRGYSDWPALN
jgi:N-ethylmaleimide reductase